MSPTKDLLHYASLCTALAQDELKKSRPTASSTSCQSSRLDQAPKAWILTDPRMLFGVFANMSVLATV